MERSLDQNGVNLINGILPGRKEQLIEVSVFLFLIVPSMVLSLFVVKPGGALTFVLVAWSTILRDLALVSLILFFLWRNREPVNQIGWMIRGGRKEIFLGVILFVPLFLCRPARKYLARIRTFCAIQASPLILCGQGRGRNCDGRYLSHNRCARGRDHFSRISPTSFQCSHSKSCDSGIPFGGDLFHRPRL